MAAPKPARKKKAKRAPLTPAEVNQRKFARRIKTMFTNMGFVFIPTEGKNATFGDKTGELDATYVFENVILVVEDTTAAKPWDHAKNKKLLAEQIFKAKPAFVSWLIDEFPEHNAVLAKYKQERFKLFYLYISEKDMDLGLSDTQLLKPMTVVTPAALNYFDKLAKTIHLSAKTDLWRFLGLKSSDIGASDAATGSKRITTTIISPTDNTGYTNGVRLVSFMISADTLLRNAYVLRKDNWELSVDLYQRLLDATKVKKIRKYVADEGGTFLNNIIVSLPKGVSFHGPDGEPIALKDIQSYDNHEMSIPDEFNTLGIIDGQHRVFAHYEGKDSAEETISGIRTKVHLLATGLVFPKDMKELDRVRMESTIFLDINANAKPVAADVLLAIQSLRDPFEDVAIARRVLESLNRMPAFKGMFQMSQMVLAPIKIASIVKFALRYLVDVDAASSLFAQWAGADPARLKLRDKDDSDLLQEYIEFAASQLDMYFKALKSDHQSDWENPDSRITSTTVINAMIIALRKSLPAVGLSTFEEYHSMMSKWKVDFSKGKFGFASSQYNMFANDILVDVFGLQESNGVWMKPATT